MAMWCELRRFDNSTEAFFHIAPPKLSFVQKHPMNQLLYEVCTYEKDIIFLIKSYRWLKLTVLGQLLCLEGLKQVPEGPGHKENEKKENNSGNFYRLNIWDQTFWEAKETVSSLCSAKSDVIHWNLVENE